MAIVKTMTIRGATVQIDDACFAGISAGELRRRYAEVDRAILTIDRNARIRKAARRQTGPTRRAAAGQCSS